MTPVLENMAREQRLVEVARARRLLVALDFDGTIAPLAPRPELARALPASADAIAALAAMPETTVAYVSGRSLASLAEVTGEPEGVLLVGSHGAESMIPGRPPSPPAATEELTILDALDAVLRLIASTAPGAWVEEKPYGRVLHARLAEAVLGGYAIRSALNSVGRGLPGVVAREGKSVAEFATRPETKGDAVEALRAFTGADAVFFAGDDRTDEDAFATLTEHDFGVHSGDGDTAAEYRVDGPEQIAVILSQLRDVRASRIHG